MTLDNARPVTEAMFGDTWAFASSTVVLAHMQSTSSSGSSETFPPKVRGFLMIITRQPRPTSRDIPGDPPIREESDPPRTPLVERTRESNDIIINALGVWIGEHMGT
jgi:hypothetical protein